MLSGYCVDTANMFTSLKCGDFRPLFVVLLFSFVSFPFYLFSFSNLFQRPVLLNLLDNKVKSNFTPFLQTDRERERVAEVQ